MDNKLSINVTVQALNYILTALADRPYKEVAALISDLREQGMNQTSAPTEELESSER